MSRWPRRQLPAVREEPPEWVRVFHPEHWRDPAEDAHWRSVNPGLEEACPGRLQAGLDWRAKCRWNTARLKWFEEHPDAKHPLEELLEEWGWKPLRRRAATG